MNKKYPNLTLPFFISVMLLAPTAVCKSLQFSSVYYVMIFSMVIFMWNPGKFLNGEKVIWLFLGVGIVTVYLDFLTYPMATLTIPLTLLCIREKDGRIKDSMKLVIFCAAMWGVGYALMWGGKWIIAAISGGEEFLEELLTSIKFRSSAKYVGNVEISRVETLKRAFEWTFSDKLWAMAAAAFAVICLARVMLSTKYVKKKELSLGLLLLAPSACCLLWVLVLANHTAIHLFFTYRTVVPVVFCVLTFLSELAESAETEKSKVKALGTVQ